MNKAELFLMVVGALGTLGILYTILVVCWHVAEAKKTQARELLFLEMLHNDLSIVDRWCRHEYPIVSNICARYRNFIATQGTWDSTVENFRQELRTEYPTVPPPSWELTTARNQYMPHLHADPPDGVIRTETIPPSSQEHPLQNDCKAATCTAHIEPHRP